MNCDDIELRLSAHLDSELSPREGRDVDVHLASCASCRRRREVLAAVRTALRSVEQDPASKRFDVLLGRRLAEVRAKRLRWRPLVAALSAAAALSLVALGLMARRQSSQFPHPAAAVDVLRSSDVGPCLHCAPLVPQAEWTAGRPCADRLSCGRLMATMR